MTIDTTPSFLIFLYILTLESALFTAVILQMQSQEPGTHPKIARIWSYLYTSLSLTTLFYILSLQLTPLTTNKTSTFSYLTTIIYLILFLTSIILTIPSATSITFPDRQHYTYHLLTNIFYAVIIILSSVYIPHFIQAAPDIPYLPLTLRQTVLGAGIGSIMIMGIASGIRYIRKLKGSSGALILYIAIASILATVFLWMKWEPYCRRLDVNQNWRKDCPLPMAFDHNAVLAAVAVVANVAVAEGALRLMAAGNGIEGYVSIT